MVAALMAASATMQQATGILGDAIESVRLVHSLQIDLLRDAHQIHRGGGSASGGPISTFHEWEIELREGLADAHRYVSSQEESGVLVDAERRVDEYLVGRRAGDAGDSPPSPDAPALATDSLAFDEAFKALDRLVEINLHQARASQALVERLGRRATTAGVAAVLFFMAGASSVLISARRLVYGPVVAIQEVIGRYGAGDRAARAPLVGPRNHLDVDRHRSCLLHVQQGRREVLGCGVHQGRHEIPEPDRLGAGRAGTPDRRAAARPRRAARERRRLREVSPLRPAAPSGAIPRRAPPSALAAPGLPLALQLERMNFRGASERAATPAL
ncbi:hypothetical protein [Sorangium sp. So ce363]|uniref:hypothetical protein n=1 Tax=Sorangium sp. So ce363 TaxID=3133304 RepID=UPI003F617BD8